VGLIVVVSLAGQAVAQGDDSTPFTRGLVDVGGYSLYLECEGEGSPAVILEAGLGQTGRTWINVQNDIAQETRVCSYDRAGIGGSDPSLLSPRPASVVAEELHALLAAAGVDAPYVLVAHSYGGFYVRTFAALYPDEVVGMVLVDTANETDPLPVPDDADPDEVMLNNREGVTVGEWRDTTTSLQEARAEAGGPQFGDLPLIVLTAPAPRQPGETDEEYAAKEQDWINIQSDLATISSNSVHTWVDDSGHFIQNDQPQLVIDAVLQVVQAVRDGRALAE